MANKSKDLTLNRSDMSLFQILQSLQNENDCVFADTILPRMVMLAAGVINTFSNEAISKNKVENVSVVTKFSCTVPSGKVEYDAQVKIRSYFCSELFSI